jgi:agmatinase
MGEDLNHGTPFYRAAQDGFVDPSRSIQIGMRTPNPETLGFEVVDVDRLLDRDLAETIAEIRARVGTAPVYLTFDIDFLDPAYAPGTGTPVVGGPTTRQARRLLHGLAGLDVVGADIVEVSPPYDHAGITALAGATLAFDLLNLISLARAARLNAARLNSAC